MSRKCQFTGKKTKVGRSYTRRGIAKKKKGIGLNITGKTKRRFLPNLFKKRLFMEEEGRFKTFKLSANALRTIDKIGLCAFLKKLKKKGNLLKTKK